MRELTEQASERIHLKATPFVKWAGGKRQLIAALSKFFPHKYERYVEPFVGGGAVYLVLQPERAILGDSSEGLMNSYNVVKEHADELIEALGRHQRHVLDKEYYYSIREQNAALLDNVARAARFIFLNKTCYNGLYRVNQQGRFNVPFGKHERAPKLYDEDNLRAISRLLQNADLVVRDFSDTALLASKGDFVYLDPPYHRQSNASNFTSYSRDDFRDEDHVHLAEIFQTLDRRGCTVLLTNSDTELVRELYKDKGYVMESVPANRTINSKPAERGNFRVLLISNYEPLYGQPRLPV